MSIEKNKIDEGTVASRSGEAKAQHLQNLLDERNKALEHEREDLNRQIEDYKKGIERLKVETNQQKLLYQKSEQNRVWLVKQIKSKEEEVRKLQEERQQVEKLPPELGKLSTVLEEAAKKRQELIENLDMVQKRSVAWEKEKGELNRKIEVLTKEVEGLRTEANQLKAINQKLGQEKSESDKQVGLFKGEIADFQIESRQRSRMWEMEKSELNKKIEYLKEEVKKLQEELQQVEKTSQKNEKISQAIEEAEEKQKEFIRDIDTLQRETGERLKLHQGIKGAYQELLRSFSIEDEISEESSRIEKSAEDLASLRRHVERMGGVGYFFAFRELRDEFERRVKEAKAEFQWDFVLMTFLRRLREEVEKNVRQPLLEEQVGKLRGFVERRGFKLIWPGAGDELVMRGHQILREDMAEGVGRGRVIRALTPGLRRGEEVMIKAGIVMAV